MVKMDSEQFEIDTKGICLLCLKDCINFSSSSLMTEFKMLLWHLKVDFLKLPNFSSFLQDSLDGLNNVELSVNLCEKCCSVTREFSDLYDNLEYIRKHLERCLQSLFQLMKQGDGDEQRVREYRRRMRTRKPQELVNVSIAENLRKETLLKLKSGSSKTDDFFSRVSSRNEENDTFGDIRIAATFPVLPSPPFQQYEEENSLNSQKKSQRMKQKTRNNVEPMDEVLIKIDPSLFQSEGGDQDSDFENEQDDSMVWNQSELEVGTSSAQYRASDSTSGNANGENHKASCDVCGKQFSSNHILSRHMILHTGRKPYNCSYCGKATADLHNHLSHLIAVHTLEYFTDKIPSGTTRAQLQAAITTELNKYRKVFKGSNQIFGCPYCNKCCPRDIYLKHHILRCHFEKVVATLTIQMDLQQPGSSVQKYSVNPKPSEHLKKSFGVNSRSKKSSPQKRRKAGFSRRKYKCGICSKTLISRTGFNMHKRIHTGLKPFTCVHCGKASRTKAVHGSHLLTMHTMQVQDFPVGTTPEILKKVSEECIPYPDDRAKYYGCMYCGIGFSKPFKLKEHVFKNHMGEVIAKLEVAVQTQDDGRELGGNSTEDREGVPLFEN